MKRKTCWLGLTLITLFLYSALAIGKTPPKVVSEPSPIQKISPAKAWKLIQTHRGHANFVILDVRTPKEFFAKRIAGAINLDIYDLDFREKLQKLQRDKTYLVYCRSGIRSMAAANMMAKMGFKKIFDLSGGILNFEKKGFPCVSGP